MLHTSYPHQVLHIRKCKQDDRLDSKKRNLKWPIEGLNKSIAKKRWFNYI